MKYRYSSPVTAVHVLQSGILCASGVATVRFGVKVDTYEASRIYIE